MIRSSVLLNGSAGFVLVYASAMVFAALTGNRVFEGGMLDWRYLLLALLISAGFLIGGTGNRKASLAAVSLFSVLFILTYGIIAVDPPKAAGNTLAVRLLVYPAAALGLAIAMRFAFRAQT